ncbi:class A beta-lactamase, subclass A2 [Pedobacter duraquae]|uniref:beta-lactamase n=1 Tax=Pedobacter duraquae TaxID=425511 RepID=A0A4R6IKH8_9SPHI|nr:class A beta-lactamase, subclass A2 [Pedobacter duraquae]TDO22465.1 beta-lactamase class A [Pedobacter duraquae]
MKVKVRLSLLLLGILFSYNSIAQHRLLRNEIASIALSAKGRVGVAMEVLEDRDTLSYHGGSRVVMQSVFKFPIAIAVLHQVDLGKLKLDQMLHIIKEDLPKNYSPLRDKYPEGNIDLPVSELLSYMVSLSDNDACDILLNKIQLKSEVERFIHNVGIKDIEIRATEAEMMANWDAQYTDWTTPDAMLKLLRISYTDTILRPSTKSFLWEIMEATSTAPKRMKGLLPPGVIVAHKTGTSSTNSKGLSPATNDVGVITLPNGKHLAIAVFVTDSYADPVTRDLVIAKITKAAYDTFSATATKHP